jgi:serine protease
MRAPFAQGAARVRRSIAILAAACAVACGGGGSSEDDDGPFRVAGTMTAAAGSAIDSDTDDLNAAFAPNDSAAQAQEIGNPVSLGGHVNRPGAQPPGASTGRTSFSGDLADWFRVSIAAGQTIRLQLGEDGFTNNLDLELRGLDQGFVAGSATTGRVEEVEVTASGDYYVVVRCVSGFSNYTLTIGQQPTSASAAADEPEFVPGQVVVRYRDDRARGAASASGRARASRVGMRHVSGDPDGPMLFAAETIAERRAAFEALDLPLSPEMRGAPGLRGRSALRADTRQIAEAMRRRPDVRSAALNYVRKASAAPSDEFYPFQWHFDQINLPQAWDVTELPANPNDAVIVAVIDTGVKLAHPDLAGQLIAGYDFISDPDIANDGGGCDGNPDDPGDDVSPGGSSYHGTHVAGTVVARTSLGSVDDAGVAGVAWNAKVMPLRVLGVGGGTDADIMAAMRYAAGRSGTCAGAGAASPARIVNMSLSGPGFSQPFQDLIDDLRADGVIFVAAAGNQASSSPQYPAAFDGVISVAAVGPTRARAPYSNFGSSIDVAAPGGDFQRDVDGDGYSDGVLSTFYSDGHGFGYAFYQGTSMATPHVAGVLALMLAIHPALTPVDIDNALVNRQITENIGSSQFFGNGLIDAARAVNVAAAGGGGATVVDPVLRIDPDGLNFGFLASELQLTATNGGNDQQPLAVTGATFTSDDGAPWLTITADSVDASGLGSYRATVARSSLADGLYTGTIHFTSDHNAVDVAVIMQVGDLALAQPHAGHHYVLLVDPESEETLAALEVDPTNGEYAFDFGEGPPGDYLLIAGTDLDNDRFICDPGEACGAFPTADTIVPLRVDRDRTDVQFTTGFSVPVGAAAAGAAPARAGYSREIGGSVGGDGH